MLYAYIVDVTPRGRRTQTAITYVVYRDEPVGEIYRAKTNDF